MINSRGFESIFKLAEKLKRQQKEGIPHHLLKGKTLGMILQSHPPGPVYLLKWECTSLEVILCSSVQTTYVGRGETIYDTAQVLSRYVDGIMIRTFAQSDVEDLARYGMCPL